MQVIPATSTFLMQNFQEFYREVLIQRETALKTLESISPAPAKKTEPTAAGAEPIEAGAAPEAHHELGKVEQESVTDSIQRSFRLMFERFSLNAQNQVGDFAISHFQEALYIMVALLDEVFLSFSWAGQSRWEDNLMEKQLFHTQVAGELIYRKIDDLIDMNDPVRNDVAAIYMMALALGFKGKYRDEDDAGKISWYRQQLYTMINRVPSTLFHPGRDYLIADTYDHIISLPPTTGLPDVRSWLIAFAAIIGVSVVISSFLWFKLVNDMDDALGQILSQAQQLGLS